MDAKKNFASWMDKWPTTVANFVVNEPYESKNQLRYLFKKKKIKKKKKNLEFLITVRYGQTM